ncbi:MULTISPECIES: FAD-binding oxidoreductase [unclassified Nocardia]|uniref:FAD-binding oxidoreductase n=1 Tax=unclassified Nocardia TaxID=2637762 RepID=UPI001CE45978|nr:MULTISPECIES: FAD-binding oxidoreductase [unclassified Nocardia]
MGKNDFFEKVRAQLGDRLLLAESSGYEDRRGVWNGMHDRYPLAICRCVTADDVSVVLRCAVDAGLPVTVRGGGHNVAGLAVADDAVQIDLSLMRQVTVDPVARLAYAEGGCLLRDVDAATTPHGLACPAGVVSHTGLGGLALGGGYGWLATKWGLTCDHIVAAEVVLADGRVVQAGDGPGQYEDLLWALRGGGGNFGVVTRFTLRLRPVRDVFLWTGVYSLEAADAALTAYGAFAGRQPADLHTVGSMKYAGDQEWIPAGLRGRPALFFSAAWFGEHGGAPEAIAPLLDGVPPSATLERRISYAELQSLGDSSEPFGNRYFTKSCYLADLSAAVRERALESARDIRSPRSSIDFEYLRGAISDIPSDSSAFPCRDAPYIYTVSAQWTDPADDAENVEWSRRGVDSLRPHHFGGTYVNYVQDETDGDISRIYGAERQRRLGIVKARYDPRNVFRHNKNIQPVMNDTAKYGEN